MMSNERGKIGRGNRWKNAQGDFWQAEGCIFVGDDSITERRQFTAATERMTFHQCYRGDIVRAQFLKCSAVIVDGTQHFLFAPVEMIADIDTCTECSLTSACDDY